jgi:hypothetical protein
MEWFPFHVSDLSNAVVSAATCEALGAWVRMLTNAYRLENGGSYEESSEHSSRQWMSIAGVTTEEVETVVAAGLAEWQGVNLVIFGYDKAQQEKAQNRSKKATLANAARWGNPRRIATGTPRRNPEEIRGEEIRGEEKREEHTEAIMCVFAKYREKFPKRFPKVHSGLREWKLIRDRIVKDGRTPEDLCLAIDGFTADPWHQGKNDRGKQYLDLELFMRDEKHVAEGISLATKPSIAPPRRIDGRTDRVGPATYPLLSRGTP